MNEVLRLKFQHNYFADNIIFSQNIMKLLYKNIYGQIFIGQYDFGQGIVHPLLTIDI